MTNKLMERIISIGLLILVLAFNPFIFAGLYIDSTSSFSFIALTKVTILAIIDCVLLILWILQIRKTKELTITPSKIYIPLFIWLASSLLSTFFSTNRTLSFFGYNSTLENSLIETLMIFIFVFIFINNIKTKEQIENIVRFFNIGIGIACIYQIIRYLGSWETNIDFLKDYLNTTSFTPVGHFGSLPIIALSAFLLSIGLVISDTILDREKRNLVIDSIVLIVTGSSFMIFLNIGGSVPEYLYLIAGIAALALIAYIIVGNTKLQQSLIPVFGLVLLSTIIGFGVYFIFTKNATQPSALPSLSLDTTWNITLDSIKNPFSKGIVGNGQGTFTYAFDRYKSEDFAYPINTGKNLSTYFTVSAQSPNTEEIRIYQSGSYFFGILLSQGLIGVVSFFLIIGFVLSTGIKKGLSGSGIMGIFSFMIFIGLSILTIFFRYDFILVFLMWFVLAIFISSTTEDEPQKNLVIGISGRSFEYNSNLNFILPSLVLLLCLWVVISTFPIFLGNFYEYQAKKSQINNKLEDYQRLTSLAAQTYSQSDIFIRESVFARSITLFNNYADVQKKVTDDPKLQDSADVKQQVNNILSLQDQLIRDIGVAKNNYPEEYKNYYIIGLILTKASEYTNLTFDSNALNYFSASLSLNTFHPDSYYQAAAIQFRQKDYTSSLNNIKPPINYRPQNLLYQATFADILASNGNHKDALTIYNALKKLKDDNSSNKDILDFYNAQNIDKDISDSTTKLNAQVTPTPTPTPAKVTPTPTPTKKK